MDSYTKDRKSTLPVRVGSLFIGGDWPVRVQSMTNTDTRDIKKTVDQIKRLTDEGCEIIRVAVVDTEASDAIKSIKKQINVPLVADIHFDYRLAVLSIQNGADKIRINPGNIGSEDRVKEIIKTVKEYDASIRIGVNSGSLEKEILEKYKGVSAQGLVESTLKHIRIFEEMDFRNIILSLKASSVPLTIESYRLISQKCSYPLHVGVTEAGTEFSATVKSSVGIGCLLAEGIGDTIRVSITGDPVSEVKVGIEILKSLGLKEQGVEIISCPTCGRCQINIIDIANEVEKRLKNINKKIKIAVMGCAVNGPGEAREADVGIAGGNNCALLFKKGEIIRKVEMDNIVKALMEEIEKE